MLDFGVSRVSCTSPMPMPDRWGIWFRIGSAVAAPHNGSEEQSIALIAIPPGVSLWISVSMCFGLSSLGRYLIDSPPF